MRKLKSLTVFIASFFVVQGPLLATDNNQAKLNRDDAERVENFDGDANTGTFFSVDVGIPIIANSEIIRDAKKTFDQSTSLGSGGSMGALRGGWKSHNENILFGIGIGALYGALNSRGGAYEAGNVGLDFSALYALGFGRVGYRFSGGFSGILQIENYLPVMEEVIVSSPTGTVKEKIDSSIELASHSTILMLQYTVQRNISLGVNFYLPAVFYGSVQGRGFSGLSAGVEYVL